MTAENTAVGLVPGRVLIRKRGTQLGETLPNSLFEIVLENTF